MVARVEVGGEKALPLIAGEEGGGPAERVRVHRLRLGRDLDPAQRRAADVAHIGYRILRGQGLERCGARSYTARIGQTNPT